MNLYLRLLLLLIRLIGPLGIILRKRWGAALGAAEIN